LTNDELDRLIDGGLRDYVAREPAFGIEARVLRRVRGRNWRHPSAWTLAACALLAIFVATNWQEPLETLNITPAWRVEAPVPVPARAARHKPRITAGERALLRFVQDHPEQAIEVFARLDTPVTVDDIEIAPLAIEPLEPQEENRK
jgi:hypothetical protein